MQQARRGQGDFVPPPHIFRSGRTDYFHLIGLTPIIFKLFRQACSMTFASIKDRIEVSKWELGKTKRCTFPTSPNHYIILIDCTYSGLCSIALDISDYISTYWGNDITEGVFLGWLQIWLASLACKCYGLLLFFTLISIIWCQAVDI